MTNRIIGFVCAFILTTLTGCGSELEDGPPMVRLGDSLCAECGMIISDERFTTATIIVGDRGNEPKLFDDFNCQMIFESKYTQFTIVDRWCHDHGSSEWIQMGDALFVKSDQLHTPMASNIAAFEHQSIAESFSMPIDGQVMDWDSLNNAD